jgi:hypothetical protein
MPKTPHDLVGHDCIRCRFPGGTLVTWRFARKDEELGVTPSGRLTVSSVHNELQAALAGRGIAHVLDDYAKPHIQDGRLVELLPDWGRIAEERAYVGQTGDVGDELGSHIIASRTVDNIMRLLYSRGSRLYEGGNTALRDMEVGVPADGRGGVC